MDLSTTTGSGWSWNKEDEAPPHRDGNISIMGNTGCNAGRDTRAQPSGAGSSSWAKTPPTPEIIGLVGNLKKAHNLKYIQFFDYSGLTSHIDTL